MKIYFAAPVTNNTPDIDLYSKIIKYLTRYGTVLNEKIGDRDFWRKRKKITFSKKEAYNFDLKLLLESDVVIAEITTPSLGVGYEIGRAIERKKPVLVLYNATVEKKLSPMITGSSDVVSHSYKTFADIEMIIDEFFNSL
jgi:nucleoside 2-deoxyribosyltransferase